MFLKRINSLAVNALLLARATSQSGVLEYLDVSLACWESHKRVTKRQGSHWPWSYSAPSLFPPLPHLCTSIQLGQPACTAAVI